MKTAKAKIAILGLVLCFFVATPAFSQLKSLEGLNNVLEEFTDNMAKSLPFNSTIGLNWAPAHIGQFLGIPPHFGVGVALGFTTMDGGAFGGLLDQFGLGLPFKFGSTFPQFGYTVEGRIGGFILPFDVGVKFGVLPISAGDIKLDYLVTGFDFRYRILEDKLLTPGISLGIGYNHLQGGISRKIGTDQEFNYTYLGSPQKLTLSAPTVGVKWQTHTLDFKAQISKSLLIITPYAGFGASVGFSKAGYGVESTITDSSGNLDTIRSMLKQFGIDKLDETGFESFNEFHGWSFRLFGGISINAALLRFDFTGLYNLVDKNFGVTLGTRVQI